MTRVAPSDQKTVIVPLPLPSRRTPNRQLAAGARVSWDDTAKQINVPAVCRFPVGTVIEAVGNGLATVRVRLDGISTAAA